VEGKGSPSVAFVLGGGGHLGGYEAGMLRALLEAGVRPDLVVGTSIGAAQGAIFAADPTPRCLDDLSVLWTEFVSGKLMKTSPLLAVLTVARSHTHFASNEALRDVLIEHLGDRRIEDFAVPYECAAASIERAGARYFGSGPAVPAVLASAAVPGLWEPFEYEGEHYMDGGVVDSIPIQRAIQAGAKTIYVLHVGRVERPLRTPRWPWEVASVTFEISRRHNFMDTLNRLPSDVEVHVLPTGEDPSEPHHAHLHNGQAREAAFIEGCIDSGYQATAGYLAERRLVLAGA
jgi:NTE family protein